jgi:hypothetical protein
VYAARREGGKLGVNENEQKYFVNKKMEGRGKINSNFAQTTFKL